MKKKFIRTVSALLLALTVLALPGDISARAYGTGQIEKVAITLSMPPVVAGEVSAVKAGISAKGCYISSVSWNDSYGQLMKEKFTFDNATMVITVNASPGYFFAGNVQVTISGEPAAFENRGTQLVIARTFSPVIWAPDIIKQPGTEKVMEGGMVSFVSYASFATEGQWSVTDTAGKEYSLDALAEKFPELVFHSASYTKLNMGPIPMEMNGYKVRCCFTGPGGKVNSGYAEIVVVPQEVVAQMQSQPVAEHEHVFDSEYSADVGCHWHACECGAADKREEHSYAWVQVKEASLDAPGIVEGECRICGHKYICRTQLDAETAKKMKNEAAQSAESPAVSAEPAAAEAGTEAESEEAERKGLFKRIAEFFHPEELEFTPD